MTMLTRQQTEFIRKEILQKGISQPDLGEDLLDHVCTAVETAMASGENFEQAYKQVMSRFGKDELKQVEVKTKALVAGQKIYYPNIRQSLGLVVLYTFLFVISGYLLGIIRMGILVGDSGNFWVNVFDQHIILIQSIQVCGCLLLAILFGRMELRERSFTKVDIVPLHPFPLSILPPIFGILFLTTVWMEIIQSWIPLPEAMMAVINQRLALYSPFSLLFYIGFLWPVLSEILFRGIILKGLLRKYTPFTAIVCSGIFFSISLLNPYNALGLFIIGLFSGWLFYRTHSILPSIVALIFAQLPHIIFIMWAKPQRLEQLMIWKNLIGNDVWYFSLGAMSLLITLFLIWRLKKTFDKHQPVSELSLE